MLAWIGVIVAILMTTGCGGSGTSSPDFQLDLVIEPSPPVVGDAKVSLALQDASGAPVVGATVRLEGNMNHAGMKPSFADLTEGEPGQYSGTLDFTMGGDWFILANVKGPDGESFEHKVDVPGVKAK